MDDMFYEYWLANLKGIKPSKRKKLREEVSHAKELYYIEETQNFAELRSLITEEEYEDLKKSRQDSRLEEDYQKMKEQKIEIVSWQDERYPERLKELKGMPYAFYVKGRMPQNRLTVSIVGARRCSQYGETQTLEFAKALSQHGVQVISGMAKGIDGAAHRGALNGRGDTFAILGSGVDICYPPEHRGLYEDLIKRGGVLSEYPPGTEPHPSFFPARNRLISGIADLVLVMEAKERSGSLITADMALEQGKDIYALPGPLNSALSVGCNRLIRQGAGILLGVEDLLKELNIISPSERQNCILNEEDNKIRLESEENLVYGKISLYPSSLEEIRAKTGLSPSKVASLLVSLQLKGYINEQSKNYYVRIK